MAQVDLTQVRASSWRGRSHIRRIGWEDPPLYQGFFDRYVEKIKGGGIQAHRLLTMEAKAQKLLAAPCLPPLNSRERCTTDKPGGGFYLPSRAVEHFKGRIQHRMESGMGTNNVYFITVSTPSEWLLAKSLRPPLYAPFKDGWEVEIGYSDFNEPDYSAYDEKDFPKDPLRMTEEEKQADRLLPSKILTNPPLEWVELYRWAERNAAEKLGVGKKPNFDPRMLENPYTPPFSIKQMNFFGVFAGALNYEKSKRNYWVWIYPAYTLSAHNYRWSESGQGYASVDKFGKQFIFGDPIGDEPHTYWRTGMFMNKFAMARLYESYPMPLWNAPEPVLKKYFSGCAQAQWDEIRRLRPDGAFLSKTPKIEAPKAPRAVVKSKGGGAGGLILAGGAAALALYAMTRVGK